MRLEVAGLRPFELDWFRSTAIRIALRAAALPEWVLDYPLVHEMAPLEYSDHGLAFRELARRYPLSESARGYLVALDHGSELD